MKIYRVAFLVISLTPFASSLAGTADAVIGGAVGGGLGAAIGSEIGGRDGAIIGSALGAAVGTAVNTDKGSRHSPPPAEVHYEYAPSKGGHPHNYKCPPGQRKKGRC